MTEMTSSPAWPYTDAPTDRRAGRFGRELGYLLASFPVGLVSFVIAVTGFSLGVSTLIIWLGLPVLVGTLLAARGFARLERHQVETATGRAMPSPRYREVDGTRPGTWLRALGDPQSWRDLLHQVIAFPVRVTSFCFAVTWTLGGLGELLYVTWQWSLPRDAGDEGLLDLMFGIESRTADICFNTAIGAVLLLTAPLVLRGLTALQAGLSRALLVPWTGAGR